MSFFLFTTELGKQYLFDASWRPIPVVKIATLKFLQKELEMKRMCWWRKKSVPLHPKAEHILVTRLFKTIEFDKIKTVKTILQHEMFVCSIFKWQERIQDCEVADVKITISFSWQWLLATSNILRSRDHLKLTLKPIDGAFSGNNLDLSVSQVQFVPITKAVIPNRRGIPPHGGNSWVQGRNYRFIVKLPTRAIRVIANMTF